MDKKIIHFNHQFKSYQWLVHSRRVVVHFILSGRSKDLTLSNMVDDLQQCLLNIHTYIHIYIPAED